jgi:hypothetical protein
MKGTLIFPFERKVLYIPSLTSDLHSQYDNSLNQFCLLYRESEALAKMGTLAVQWNERQHVYICT